MGKKSAIALATILTLAIAGCGSEDTQQAANPTPPAPPAAKLPPATPSLVAKLPAKTQSFNNPLVVPKNAPTSATGTSNLIQLTNATERINLVSKGRTDPFAQIVGQTVATMPTSTVARKIPILPPLPTLSTVRAILTAGKKLPTRSAVLAQSTMAKTPKPKLNPALAQVLPKVLPQVVPNPTLVSVLPPPAQPELAKAVVVTGVVQIGKEPQAIIKVPNEQTSRYVQAGQRLANGVLIKRIEMNEGSNPVVILEQYGIEVARMVGEAPTGSTPSAATGGNSVSVTTPTQSSFSVGAS
ncbi:hypothetical protein I8752_26190 [Nostocaceae cyanobacterium CENA369]|uniref:Uncharacterized protein n=1 Tax=Dendronalium phyllosphericum CENA369 TaxID=1725256 RepID=A0A8J7LGK7_9NOST|nr:hypothetical protein [Dendronalium phyllosphericum]MBH8576416.1 hypothetical protein [Dendronalium phyllosphericum CENA369]